nr:hypothetical protein [Angustibacter aerolatus]
MPRGPPHRPRPTSPDLARPRPTSPDLADLLTAAGGTTHDGPVPTARPGLARRRLLVAAAFLAQGLTFAALLTHLPAYSDRWSVGPLAITLLVVGVALAAGLGSVLAGAAAERVGSGTVLQVAVAGIAVGAALTVLAPAKGMFLVAFPLWGVAVGAVDATTNMQAVAVQRALGRSVLAQFHAAWSLGGIAGALWTSLGARLQIGLTPAVLVVTALVLLLAAALRGLGGALPAEVAAGAASGASAPSGPTEPARWRPLLVVGAAVVCYYVVDSAVSAWSALYVRDEPARHPHRRLARVRRLPGDVAAVAGAGRPGGAAGRGGTCAARGRPGGRRRVAARRAGARPGGGGRRLRAHRARPRRRRPARLRHHRPAARPAARHRDRPAQPGQLRRRARGRRRRRGARHRRVAARRVPRTARRGPGRHRSGTSLRRPPHRRPGGPMTSTTRAEHPRTASDRTDVETPAQAGPTARPRHPRPRPAARRGRPDRVRPQRRRPRAARRRPADPGGQQVGAVARAWCDGRSRTRASTACWPTRCARPRGWCAPASRTTWWWPTRPPTARPWPTWPPTRCCAAPSRSWSTAPTSLRLLAAAAPPQDDAPLRVCLDVDASLRLGRLHLGVRRSPLHSPDDAGALAATAARTPGVRVVGVMFYEAQVAGLPDASPAVRLVKRRSLADLAVRRAAVVRAVERACGDELEPGERRRHRQSRGDGPRHGGHRADGRLGALLPHAVRPVPGVPSAPGRVVRAARRAASGAGRRDPRGRWLHRLRTGRPVAAADAGGPRRAAAAALRGGGRGADAGAGRGRARAAGGRPGVVPPREGR